MRFFSTSSPRRREPAKVLLLGESGAALSFQGQTFKVARHCVRRKVRASVEHEASREDAFGDLCRPAPPMGAMAQPPNPPLGSLNLYKRPNPPFPGPLSPDLAPSGKRTRFGMTLAPRRRLLPNDPCLLVWIRTIKGPSTSFMKYAHRLHVRRICEPTMMTSPVAILASCVNNEVMQEGYAKPLFARDYE